MKPATLRKLRSFAVKYANTQISKRDLLAGVNRDPSYGWYVDEWENVSVGANEEWDLNFHMGWGKHDHLYVVAYPCVLDKDGNYVKRNMDKDYRVINFRVVKKGRTIALVKTRKCTFP